METGEGDHVDSQLPQISVELTGETKASGDTGHGERHKVVQVAISRGGELQGAEANVVQSFIVNAKSFVGVLDELMNREGGIVGFDNGVRDLGGKRTMKVE